MLTFKRITFNWTTKCYKTKIYQIYYYAESHIQSTEIKLGI